MRRLQTLARAARRRPTFAAMYREAEDASSDCPNRSAGEALLGEFAFERCDQGAILTVDGSLPAETIVVLGHFEQSLPGDISAAENVFEKRNDIFRALRSAEGHEQQRVINHLLSV